MSEDKVYKDGDIVWVKLGNNWWPGEVTGPNRHPEGLIKHLKRVPYCVVKFFNENTYEYVRSGKQIFPFQCAKQEEFIRKGYSLYNSGNSFMEKFPNDVEVAKRLTRRKETPLIINDRPDSIVKAILGQPLIRTCDDYDDGTEYKEKRRSGDSITKILNITQNHNEETLNNKKHDGSQTTSTSSSLPSNNTKNVTNTSASLNTSNYQCNLCDFTSVRQNVMILHRKMHSNRNSLGSSNTTSSSSFSSSTTTNSKLTPATAGATVAKATTNVSNNRNQTSQQSEIVHKNKTNSKTKASTITTTTATTRATRTPTAQKETNATATPVTKTRAVIDSVETAITPPTPTETNNRITEIQTTTRSGRTNKSKTDKKATVKEKKEESAYSAILSDFCPSDTEIPSSPEEKQSRRSLRHCKNSSEDSTTKITTVCIDLSESTKTIQKIPKKREYSSLQLQKETSVEIASPIVVSDPDVVCLADKEVETAATTTTTLHSAKPKKDAEEIRRMLLEDWSDDDETPNDTIVVEDRSVVENNENNESLSEPSTEQHNASVVSITSTPVAKTPPASVTGRIRNIPKKDRRDVVLQDFNSDLSLIQADNVVHNTKCMALDLDSSSSSVVEIIEDEQPSIITINDDEEQENSKSRKQQTDVILSESKESDSAVGLINDKSASAATSTTTLSCFDFQEEEEEQDTTTPTISHFKKKYLSVEKLQNLSSTNSEELREDMAKSRAELAEKDQRLAAEIESLLEQTQPPVADLLNANSFEESISVKDLPIKERGKRIFKSRNKTRLEEKSNTEVVAITSVDANLIAANATIEQYKSLDISNPNTEEEINTDKEETNLQQNSENTSENELIIVTDQDNTNREESSVDIVSQEILQNSHIELPKYLEDQQLAPNENKENEDLSGGNKDSLEEPNGDNNTAEFRKKQMENDITLDSNELVPNPTVEQNDVMSNQEQSSMQLLNGEDVTVEQQDVVEETELENHAEESNENSAEVIDINECNEEVKKNVESLTPEISETFVTEESNSSQVDTTENEVNAEISQIVEPLQTPLEEDSVQDSISVTETPNSPKVIVNNESELKEITKPAIEITSENTKDVTQQQGSENVFKIRVKSPDQLFEPAFVSDSQQEQELQPTIVDGNIDTRLITTTPTDENSSMGASDTGAEFGSPTSMLSEERLPTFRFQSNQTPQPEMETVQRELQEDSSQEAVPEATNLEVAKTEPNEGIKENLLYKDEAHIFEKSTQKLLQQRRFSMDLDSLHTGPKSIKRPRLSVDDNTLKIQNTFEKSHEEFIPLTMSKDKSEVRVRPKSRHVKITPRRNVSELFKSRSLMDINDSRNTEKCSLLESVKETQSMEDVVETIEKELENHKECDNSISKENSEEMLKTIVEKDNSEVKQPQSDNSNSENFDKSVPSGSTENLDLIIETIKEVNEENQENQENAENVQLKPKTTTEETIAVLENIEESNVPTTDVNDEIEVESATTAYIENNSAICENSNNENTNEISKPEAAESPEENCNKEIHSQFSMESDITNSQENETSHIPKPRESTAENMLKESEPAEAPLTLLDTTDNNTSTPSITNSIDTNKTHNDQKLEKPFSPGVPPATPQEREVVIESENLSPFKNTQLQAQIESLNEITIRPLTPKVQEKFNELNVSSSIADEEDSLLKEVIARPTTPKENEKIVRPITPQEIELVNHLSPRPITPQQSETLEKTHSATPQETESEIETRFQSITNPETENLNETKLQTATIEETTAEPIIACETFDKLINPPHAHGMTVDFENNIAMPCTPLENYIEEEIENPMQTPLTPQAKDLIIECEPLTPQGIIECDHNIPAQITPEKEVIVESDVVLSTPPPVIQDKDIIIEDNLQLEEKDTLLEREFQVVHPKEMPLPADVAQSPTLQTDADKAAEEFLIEFDSIVNHSHSVEEDVNHSTIGEAVNADDLINNIIEEVHEDQPLKEEVPTTSEASLQYEPMTTYTVVAKNSWNQIFKESFNRQLPPAKRRQTICFEISDTKEGVACKKQALDFESILPVSKTVKRTAERKLTLPAIETKLSNSQQQHNILALNHNQLTLNKKIIPTTKRKLSIEDNITSFIIERPKQTQQQSTTAVGPPPLQRIRPLNRQGQTSSKANAESFSEPPPLQSHDHLFNELFQTESSSPTPCSDLNQKPDKARIINQQILSSPAISSVSQAKPSDTKISKNKQIGVDSRGNKYVIIKTPPTDIIVQPTLTSSTAAAVTATNNFGTTITIQPLPRSSSEAIVTKTTTKNKNVSAAATTSRKQQQQHMKQISITVPAKSPLEITKSLEAVVKTPPRNKRKTAHAKAVAATATANSNINSAKHRQAMEALSRRLSIAAEAPPLSKISRTATTHVQTQITNSNNNNSNLATFFATSDPQISNIAQQQLMQLQQQQQQQQQTSTLPPPIILNKNAHQHSALQRKPRKTPQQLLQQQQQQQQQAIAAKSSQLIQQLQQQQHQNQLQQQQQQQHQQIQQHFITQITAAHQPQHQIHYNHHRCQQIQQPNSTSSTASTTNSTTKYGIIITTTATEDDNVIDSNTQLIALPTQPYPGYSETFLLCKVKGNTCKPVDNVPLYLNHQLNELVPVPLEALEGGGHKPQEHQIEIKATNAPQQLLAGQNTNTGQDSENNLQMSNLNCNIMEGEISAGIEAEHHQLQQHHQQQQHHHQQQQHIMEECAVDENIANASNNQIRDFGGSEEVNPDLISNNGILLNIEGQQVLLDAATFAHLLANPDANTQLISDDGTEYVLTHEVLAALQMQQEQQQALELANANAAAAQQQQQHQHQQHQHLEARETSDIIAVALAGSELYDSDVLSIDTSQGMQLIDGNGSIVFPAQTGAITQQHLTPPAVVTNAVLDQSPIMSTLEVPSSIATAHKLHGTQLITVPSHHLTTSANAALGGRSNLEDSLAAIGVTASSTIPSSLGLPITVTNPNIASKVTSAGPLNEMLQFVSHRPATAAATAAAVAAAALAGESRIFTD
ncbi:LOW QUALITY PROTEIN: protein split ends [Lucilia sericata]|uniref:LOW QUALITY PROTEIN: protein split ends n=1 Tax=Lucilia sericata TaxID=13632 RepID=UPI0018A8574C|nr:LOW QUALITY PROTEIN: protein split ends [Lucilia sericata]